MIDKARMREWARLAKEDSGGPRSEDRDTYQMDRGDVDFYFAAREAVPALIEWLAEERARRLRFLQYYHGGRVLWEDEKPSRRESWLKQARLELGLEAP